MSIKGLILDFGEVLVRAQSKASVAHMASIAGLSADDFARRYWEHRDAYDGGLTAAAYWQRVLQPGPDGPADRIDELVRGDCASWTDYRDEVWDIAASFRTAGGRTAMLSNGVPEIVAKVRRERPLERYFDAVVISYEVGCAKPDPAIYRLCLERLGVPPASALFVDDRIVNLRAAADAGLQTLHFTGDGDVAALRERAGVP